MRIGLPLTSAERNWHMKVLVTGVKGQLGFDVVNELKKRGHTPVGVDVEDMDITDAGAVDRVVGEAAPDAVIHCAAYTAVDRAEEDVDTCRRVNAYGTENIAKVCARLGCKLMYISTDYVFDGQGTTPWQPDCKDYKPLNVYGQTKLEGEFAEEYKQGKMVFSIAHTAIPDEAARTKAEIEREFPDMKVLFVDNLSLSVACHTGPGALGIGLMYNGQDI